MTQEPQKQEDTRVMPRYITQVFILSALFIFVATAVNLIIDPMAIFDAPLINRLNASKPEIGSHERVFKTLGVQHVRPEVLIVGSSRPNRGIDPDHPALPKGKVYNAATNAQSYMESYERVVRADRNSKLSMVIFPIDFRFANASDIPTPDDTLHAPSWKLPLKAAFSLDTLLLSLETLKTNLAGKPLDRTYRIDDGFCEVSPDYAKLNGGYFRMIAETQRAYIQNTYRAPPRYLFTLTSEKNDAPLDWFRKLVAYCYANDIQLKVMTAPIHARLMETIWARELWPLFEEWKRSIVRIVEEEATVAGKPAFDVWDFSSYNAITTEPLPLSKESTVTPRFYLEISHYTPLTGSIMLDKVLGYSREQTLPEVEGFGTKITSANIEEQLKAIGQQHASYPARFPEDYALFMTFVEKYAPKTAPRP